MYSLTFRHLVVFFILCLFIASCDEDEDCVSCPGVCESYVVSIETDTRDGVWTGFQDEDEYENLFVTPSDVGGGYFSVRVTANEDLAPDITIDNDLSDAGNIISSFNPTAEDISTHAVSFLAFPDETYSLLTENFFTPQIDGRYDISWEFRGRMDCYEPNDQQTVAAAIPVGENIQAFAIAGYKSSVVSDNASQTKDWYSFNFDEPRKVRVTLTQVPSDIRMEMSLLINGVDVPFDVSFISGDDMTPGSLFFIESQTSFEGEIKLEISHLDALRALATDDTSLFPDHWNTPYEFVVSEQ